ncbi:hypothetical protein ACFTQ7_03800 [Lysinibacillus sp. NPDC056959]|uniref:hypothetical protein n=1 Tax=Lysinibacillus sp. NPDC056959 TaxID=3345981 RepID=UPI0036454913
MIEKDYEMIVRIFEEYGSLYKVLLNKVEDIVNETVLWSNSYLEFYPYQYELNQLPKPKIYKNEPKRKEGIIVNRLKNNELYFSYRAENKGWGSSFIINEVEKKICLRFLNNDDDEMVLSQVYCVIYKRSMIEKVIYYTRDDDIGEETFRTDRYLYNDNNTIQTIIRDGFFEEKINVLHTRTFRFEYVNGDVLIYSKQLKKNLKVVEDLLYTSRKAKKNKQ